MIKLCLARNKFQALILVLIISIPLISIADTEVTLQWDFNKQTPDGYRLYCREEGQDYEEHEFVWQGDHTFNSCTVDGLDETKTYYFVVRAFSDGDESDNSNEIRYEDGAWESLSSISNLSDTSGGGSGGGGGGGGGCFIQSFF